MEPFIACDTEDNSAELMSAGKSGFEKQITQCAGITSDGEEYHNKGDVDKFVEWMMTRDANRIYFHNLQYDLGNLFADKLHEFSLTMVGGRLIKAQWKGKTFVDSFNLFPTSLASLGDAIGLEKLKFDANSRDYVMRDCEIILEALTHLRDTLDSFKVKKIPNTLGSMCVRVWKAMGGRNWSCHSDICKDTIFGGRVELFSKGGEGCVMWTDVNSLYPWAMTQKYPHECKQTSDMKEYGLTEATVDVPMQPYAPLPYRTKEADGFSGISEGSILFPCGRFTGTWTNHELRNAVENHGVKILKLHYTFGTDRASDYYGNFVKKFYKKRLESKTPAYKLIYKLLMNNLYGQLGMSGKVIKTCKLTEIDLKRIQRGDLRVQMIGNNVLKEFFIPLPEHCNYLHASYVTSYGRLRLLEFMRKVPPEDMVYCDTDSLFFFAKDWKAPFPTGDGLGEMKLEDKGSRITTYAPKVYSINDIVKAKGVPRRLARKFVEQGYVEYDAPF
ncbi:hypothetical protein EB061_08825, partial [bacterium]|nr:hypothetical protein [bacterium]